MTYNRDKIPYIFFNKYAFYIYCLYWPIDESCQFLIFCLIVSIIYTFVCHRPFLFADTIATVVNIMLSNLLTCSIIVLNLLDSAFKY